MNIWNNAALPTIRKDKAIVKLTKLVENFHSVFKHWEKYETVLFQQNKLKEYTPKLEELFDISVLDIHHVLKSSWKKNPLWEEDYQFYNNQKLIPQVGWIGGKDAGFSSTAKKIAERAAREQMRIQQNFTTSERDKDGHQERHLVNVTSDPDEEEVYTPSRSQTMKRKTEKNMLINNS